MRRAAGFFTLLGLALVPGYLGGCTGCTGRPEGEASARGAGSSDSRLPSKVPAATEKAAPGAEKPVKPPFEPPPLEALRDIRWVPQRVADGLDLLEDHLARQPPPPPDAEALSLRNIDDRSNARIAAALGRLPANEEEVDWDATLTRFLFGEPKQVNAILFSTVFETEIVNLIYAKPFGFDWELVPFGDQNVVVQWSTSEDKMMDRVVLRDDITWSDGTPFTAHDLEFAFRVITSPRVPCPALRSQVEKVKAVKAYDDRTVVYFHREPLVTNIWNVNFPALPRHIFETTLTRDPTMVQSDEHNRLNRSPFSSGPYRFVSWKPGVEIVCERRPEWYEKDGKRIRKKPFFKTIRFRTIQDRNAATLAFKKGELDDLQLSADQWHEATGEDFHARGTKVRGEEWACFFIAWNQKPIPDAPFFKDRRVREALSYAFPHQEFLEKICFGLYVPAPGIFHPNSWMADPSLKPLQQDLERAQRLLAEAGWKDSDGDGVLDRTGEGGKVPFRFTLLIGGGSPIAVKMASLLKRDLEKLGIICDVRELEAAALNALNFEHKFQAAAIGWGTGVDPDTLRNILTTEAYEEGRNYVGYSNPRVDELFERGQHEFDRTRRAEIYREIERILARDFPYTLLYFRTSFYAVARGLHGVNFSPRGPYLYSPGIFALWRKKA